MSAKIPILAVIGLTALSSCMEDNLGDAALDSPVTQPDNSPEGTAYDGTHGRYDSISGQQVHLRFAGFIPCDAVGIPAPFIRRWSHYRGDGRGFDFVGAKQRSRASLSVLVSRNRIDAMSPILGESQGFTSSQVTSGQGNCFTVRAGQTPGERKLDPNPEIMAWHSAKGQNQGYELTKTRLKLHATDPIPYGPVPSLDAYVDIWIWWSGNTPVHYYLDGKRDSYPSYELYINGNRVYAFDALAAGTSPLDLALNERTFDSGSVHRIPRFPPGVSP